MKETYEISFTAWLAASSMKKEKQTKKNAIARLEGLEIRGTPGGGY